MRSSVKRNLRGQRVEMALYGGGRNAKDGLPGKTGLIRDTRRAIESLNKAIKTAREWNEQLYEFAFGLNLPVEELHTEITGLARRLPRLEELASALVPPKLRAGAKTVNPQASSLDESPLRKRDIVASLRKRLLAAGASRADAKTLATRLTKAVTAKAVNWRSSFDLHLPDPPK